MHKIGLKCQEFKGGVMPKKLERQLKRQVNQDHPNWSEERKDAYVYGTLRKTGWKPSHQKKK